jgi:hypothetical protein
LLAFTVISTTRITVERIQMPVTQTDTEHGREINDAMETSSIGDLMNAIIRRAFSDADLGGSDDQD